MSQPPSASGTPAPAANGSSAPSATPAKHSAAEIGWQFINQYYKHLHGESEKLHRFYTKKSTFSHGTEGDGDENVPVFGQQDIHAKIMSLGFTQPRAFVHSIHSQSSQSGGILIQVIGEMQNGSDDAPWKKFTQTFFLAEQPNGYFVLNDVFRYLKEEGDFDEEDTDAAEITEEAEEKKENVEEAKTEQAETTEPITEGALETSTTAEESAAQDEKTEPESEALVAPEAAEPVKEQVETAPEPPVSEAEETPAPEVVEEKEEVPEPAPAAKEEPTPAVPAPTPAQAPKPAAAPVQPPKPTGPPPPRTWASTAAAAKGAWGTALATKEAASTNAPAASTPIQPTRQQRPAPQQNPSTQGAASQNAPTQAAPAAPANAGGKFPLLEAAKSVTTPICFVKLNNWQAQDTTPPLSEGILESVLGRFGEIVKIDFVKAKACAFVEYKAVESARKAIIASLRTQDGGEGGIKTPSENGGFQKIIVESRKEKEDRKGAQGPAPQQQGQGQGQGQNQQGPKRQGQAQGQRQGQRGGRGGRGGPQGQGQQGQAQQAPVQNRQ